MASRWVLKRPVRVIEMGTSLTSRAKQTRSSRHVSISSHPLHLVLVRDSPTAQRQTTNTDVYYSLLETGSTQLIRNTAATQLADVQKAHPEELFNLLTRVVPYLRHKT